MDKQTKSVKKVLVNVETTPTSPHDLPDVSRKSFPRSEYRQDDKVPVNVETNLSKIIQAEKGVVPNYLRSSL
jgi:hypothetical protein